MNEITLYADYEPGNPPLQFPEIKLYEKPDKSEPQEGPIVVDEETVITFEKVTEPTESFSFDGLSVNSASTEIPDLDWYVEPTAAYLKDYGGGGSGIVTYLYTLSITTGDGKTVYLDPQLVNTGGTGGGGGGV